MLCLILCFDPARAPFIQQYGVRREQCTVQGDVDTTSHVPTERPCTRRARPLGRSRANLCGVMPV